MAQLPRAARHRTRRLAAILVAIALIGIPWIGSDRVETTTAAVPCFRLVDGRFDAVGPDSTNLNGEWVVVKNACGRTISLGGWRIRDRDGHTYRFPSWLRMANRSAIKVHSGRGSARVGHRFMGRTTPIWNNRSWERAYLVNSAGVRVSTWPRAIVTSVPAPDPAPTPAATPAPTAGPDGGDAWSVPFLSRPTSGAIRRSGNCDGIVIENLTFKDLGPDVEAIHLEGCANVTIRNNDFARVAQAVTVLDSTNVRIEWNRYLDIVGPHARVGKHRANFVQLVRVSRGYIGHNKGRGGDTEDIVSMYESGGTEASPFVIERNHFEGSTWTSTSGSGIALGDGASAWSIARGNTLLNVGQVGMFIAGGTNQRIIDNVIFGEQRTSSNVGLYVWNQSGSPCSGHEVSGNQVSWRRADGASNPAWNAGNCGTVSGWSSNTWNAVLDPASLRVGL